MSRRRLMMQAGAGKAATYEIEYSSECGAYPENIEGWSWRKGSYNGSAGVGGKSLTDGLLVLKANHMYENTLFYPTEHLSAANCEASVMVEAWMRNVVAGSGVNTGIVRIGLTDGNVYAIAGVSSDCLYIGNGANDNGFSGSNTTKISITAPQNFVFKVRLKSGAAEYFIDDELIYAQDELPTTEQISYDYKTAKFVDAAQNFIGVGCCCITTVSNMKYKEF